MGVVLNYGPRMKRFALRPIEEDKRINIPVGSIRSGKTWGLHAKILRLCDYGVSGRKLITGISKEVIFTNILTDLFDIVTPRNYDYNKQTGDLRLFKSRWKVMGARDLGSEKFLRGSTIGAVVSDEVTLMPQSFFQMLLSRMSPAGARFYGSTNTDSPYHWLKTEYLDNPEIAHLVWSQTFTMDDNPNLTPEFVAEQKLLYTGMFYQRFILAQWVLAEGAVYGGIWDDAINTYSEPPVGLYGAGGHQAHVIPVDYGTANPTVFLDGLDDGRKLWYDREYYWDSKKEQRQKTDVEYADDLETFIKESNSPLQPLIVVDPSAASFKVELQKRGLWVKDADNEVMDGIRVMGVALKRGLCSFHKDRCPKTIRETVAYSWPKESSDATNDKKEGPLKKHDHGPDAGRYGVKEVFKYTWRLSA